MNVLKILYLNYILLKHFHKGSFDDIYILLHSVLQICLRQTFMTEEQFTMDQRWSYQSLEPHLLNIRIGGYFQIDPSSSRIKRHLHKLYCLFILFLTVIYTTQQVIKVYQVRRELNIVIETIFLLLTHLVSIYKEIIMLVKVEAVQELLDIMRGKLFNHTKEENKALLRKTAREAKLILRISNITALITCFLWIVYRLVLFNRGEDVTFAIWLPFKVDKNPEFFLTLIYVWVQTSWLAYNNTTIDVIIAFFLEQCTTQIKILSYNLEHFVQNCKMRSINTSESVLTLFDIEFRNILHHHYTITRFAGKVEDIYGGPLFCQFLCSGWILCTTAYRLVEINIDFIEFISMILYMVCMLVQIFLYCFYGSGLIYASEKLIESAYFMDWLELPIQKRKHLILFMEKLKRPIVPRAGIIVPLSNATFVSVSKSSYTFYAFLKNTE